jgi:hypothetical protein
MVKHGGSVTTKHQENIRKQNQSIGSVLLKTRRDPVRGTITAVRPGPDGDYFYEVRVRPDAVSTKETGFGNSLDIWFPLAEDASVIALLYGDRDMILNSKCRIEFSSANPKTGMVFIEVDLERRNLRAKATTFNKKAFLYATAGNGKAF